MKASNYTLSVKGNFLRRLIIQFFGSYLIKNLFKTFVLLVMPLTLTVTQLTAQSEVDSLELLLPHATGERRVDILTDLASYLSTVSTERSLDYLKSSYELLSTMNYPRGKMKAWLVEATFESQRNRLTAADSLLNRAIETANELKDNRSLSEISLTAAVLKIRQGRYADGLSFSLQGLKASTELEDPELMISHLSNMGYVYQRIGQLEQAESHFLQGIELAYKHKLKFRLGQLYINLGLMEYSRSDLKASIKYNQKAYDTFEEIGDTRNLGKATQNLGFAFNQLGDSDKALEYYSKSLQLKTEIGDKVGISFNLLTQARIWNDRGNLRLTESKAFEALKVATEIDNNRLRSNVFKFLSEVYDEEKLVVKAYEYYRKYTEVMDAIQVAANQGKIAEMTAQFELDKKEDELSISEQEVILLGQEKDLLQTKQLLLLLALLLLASTVIGTIIIYRTKIKASRINEALAVERSSHDRLLKERIENELTEKKKALTVFAEQLRHKNIMLTEFQEKVKKLEEEEPLKGREKRISEIVNTLERKSGTYLTWQEFRLKFDEVHPKFVASVMNKSKSLTATEIDTCILLKINLSYKEMAQILNISYDGIKKSVMRLYKKLGFQSSEEMRLFITEC